MSLEDDDAAGVDASSDNVSPLDNTHVRDNTVRACDVNKAKTRSLWYAQLHKVRLEALDREYAIDSTHRPRVRTRQVASRTNSWRRRRRPS